MPCGCSDRRAPQKLVMVGTAASRFTVAPIPPECTLRTLVVHGEQDETVPLADVMDWARPQRLAGHRHPAGRHFFHGQLPLLHAGAAPSAAPTDAGSDAMVLASFVPGTGFLGPFVVGCHLLCLGAGQVPVPARNGGARLSDGCDGQPGSWLPRMWICLWARVP